MRQLLRIMFPALLALLLSAPGSAQEEAEADVDVAETVTEESSEASEATETSETDDDSYLDIDDDDFRPSEEIPADQSVDFPTDI